MEKEMDIQTDRVEGQSVIRAGAKQGPSILTGVGVA